MENSIFLVGGLTPRYLIKNQPPAVPAHVGTGDVDVLVDMNLLVDTQAYSTPEGNIRAIGFERSLNNKDQRLSWRWQRQHDHGIVLILEFLEDAGDAHGGALQELPSDCSSVLSGRRGSGEIRFMVGSGRPKADHVGFW